MNKIIIENNEIITNKISNSIIYEYQQNELLNSLSLTINRNTSLNLIHSACENIKLNITIEVLPNVEFKLNIYRDSGNFKVQTKYNLFENSKIVVTKINDINTINEKEIFSLNDNNAEVNYLLKTVSTDDEKYDIAIYHKHPNTISNINTNGVNIKDGKLTINVTTYIPKKMKSCHADQANRIINLTNNKCLIRPNLLIDEYDVIANHSALVGNFKDEEIFYLERLGLNYDQAIMLLIESFLKSKLTDNKIINQLLSKYWR